MTTSIIEVASTADDGTDWGGAWYPNGESNDAVLKLGRYGGITNYTAFRFQLPVGYGTVLTAAYLRLYTTTQSGTPYILFNCENVDNSSALNGTLPHSRTLTSSTVTYITTTNEFSNPQQKDFNILTCVQEVFNRAGLTANNYLTVITQDPVENRGGTNYVGVEDYANAGGHKPKLVLTYTGQPAVTGGATTMYDGEVGVVFTGINLNTVVSATLVNSGVSQEQSITAQSASSLTITCSAGNVPYGSVTLQLFDGTYTTNYSMTLTAILTHGYVVTANQATDESSVAYSTTPVVLDGDVYEWTEPTKWVIDTRGSGKRLASQVDTTLTYRRWSMEYKTWSDYGVITVVSTQVPPIQVDAGLVSYSESPLIVSRALGVTVGIASCTETPLSIGISKRVSVGLVYTSEVPLRLTTSSGAQPLTRSTITRRRRRE